MRKLFAALILTSLVMPSVYGQANSAPRPRPLPSSAAADEEKSQSQKSVDSRSFLQRLFGVRPAPTPMPTPPPVVKHTPRPRPKPAPDTKTEPVKKVGPKVPPAETVAPPTTVKPKAGKGGKKGTAAAAAMIAGDDATKFKAAKAKAMEDPHIKDLKSKADGEVNEAEAHKALLNYNRALFQKIREVDPSVSDYSGRVEQSMDKRIGSEKKE